MGTYKMGYELVRAVQSFSEIFCLSLMLLQQNGDLWGQLQLSAGSGTSLWPTHISLGRHAAGAIPKFCKHPACVMTLLLKLDTPLLDDRPSKIIVNCSNIWAASRSWTDAWKQGRLWQSSLEISALLSLMQFNHFLLGHEDLISNHEQDENKICHLLNIESDAPRRGERRCMGEVSI